MVCAALRKFYFWRWPCKSKCNGALPMRFHPCGGRNCSTGCLSRRRGNARSRTEVRPIKLPILETQARIKVSSGQEPKLNCQYLITDLQIAVTPWLKQSYKLRSSIHTKFKNNWVWPLTIQFEALYSRINQTTGDCLQ
jgi:hypothetical protein